MEKISFEQLRKNFNAIAAAAQEAGRLKGVSVDIKYQVDVTGGYEIEVALSKYLPEEILWKAVKTIRYGAEPEENQDPEGYEKLLAFIKETFAEEAKAAEAQIAQAHERLTRISNSLLITEE